MKAKRASDAKELQLGAFHLAEIEFVFGQLDSKAGIAWRPQDRQLSAAMQKYWSNYLFPAGRG
jgi:carboxylesterase type B